MPNVQFMTIDKLLKRITKQNNKMEQQTVKNLNVFLLGLAFMLVFAAFQTMGNVQTVILDSAKNATSGQCTLRFLSTKTEPMFSLSRRKNCEINEL